MRNRTSNEKASGMLNYRTQRSVIEIGGEKPNK
jgi:hypothetical protein